MKLVGLGQESARCLWLDIRKYTSTEIGFGISWFYFLLYVLLKVRKYFAFVHGKFHHTVLSHIHILRGETSGENIGQVGEKDENCTEKSACYTQITNH